MVHFIVISRQREERGTVVSIQLLEFQTFVKQKTYHSMFRTKNACVMQFLIGNPPLSTLIDIASSKG